MSNNRVQLWVGWLVNHDSCDNDPYTSVEFSRIKVVQWLCDYVNDWYCFYDVAHDEHIDEYERENAADILALIDAGKWEECWAAMQDYMESYGGYFSWDIYYTWRDPPGDTNTWWRIWLDD